MSANAPRKQFSRMACIMEVHSAPQVADEDNNSTMDCDPVAPVGGPPGDDSPGSDPGDDNPNNPFNDDKDDDDEVEDQLNQLDPGLIVFSNLAGAINTLARNAQRNSESSSSRTHVHKPDTFDGTCHGSTSSPSALSEEDSKGGRDGSRGEQGSSQRY